ncbi:hypothetical protein CTZ27_24500 [Streptomyces griseocarneus]|nr:hypothetical protein CTZ27_24500 [Streptomyces griseocarneus]
MHFHGYSWVGDKAVFDRDGIRRPPSSAEPAGSSPPDVLERYREAATAWRASGVPPLEPARWLTKPAALIQGTWQHPMEAARWLEGRLREYAPRFASAADRASDRITRRVAYAAATLAWGGDVCFGYYLGQPLFLSLTAVACSPNRALPEARCPREWTADPEPLAY